MQAINGVACLSGADVNNFTGLVRHKFSCPDGDQLLHILHAAFSLHNTDRGTLNSGSIPVIGRRGIRLVNVRVYPMRSAKTYTVGRTSCSM